MYEVNLQAFRQLAEARRNDILTVDINSGELKTSSNNIFRRAISWLRQKTGGSVREQTERHAAYNGFLRGLNDSVYYDRNDIASIEGRLRDELLAGKPLSTRRVKQLLTELDTPQTGRMNPVNYHENRVAAHYLSGRDGGSYLSRTLQEKIAERAALNEAAYEVGAEHKEKLAQRIYESVMAAGGPDPDDPSTRVTPQRGFVIAERLVDEFLDAEELRHANLGAPPAGMPVEESETGSAALTQEPVPGPASGAGAQARDFAVEARSEQAPEQQAAAGEKQAQDVSPAGAAAQDATRADMEKTLSRQLDAAGLPDKVRKQVRQALADGRIKSASDLTRTGNDKTAQWVQNNRVEQWYREGLKQNGVAVPKQLKVPPQLARRIAGDIRGAPDLVAYHDVKARARAQVKRFLSDGKDDVTGGKTDMATLSKELEAIHLPNDVRKEMRRELTERRAVYNLSKLAARTNHKTADWILDNRIGKWYRDGLEAAGRPVPKRGEVPQRLVDDIADSVSSRETLFDYDEAKSFARGKIAAYLREGGET